MQQIVGNPRTPTDLFNGVFVVMVALREALELGVLPPDAMPVPGVPGAYLSPMSGDLGMMVEYHETTTPKGHSAYYLARAVDLDDFLNGF